MKREWRCRKQALFLKNPCAVLWCEGGRFTVMWLLRQKQVLVCYGWLTNVQQPNGPSVTVDPGMNARGQCRRLKCNGESVNGFIRRRSFDKTIKGWRYKRALWLIEGKSPGGFYPVARSRHKGSGSSKLCLVRASLEDPKQS